MSNLVFSPDTFKYWGTNRYDESQRLDVDQFPLKFSHNLQAKSEASLGHSHVHYPLEQNDASCTIEDVASDACSISRNSDFSRDSGYVSINGGLLASVPHSHWCPTCKSPQAYATCDGWKRHMKEHEVTYPCLKCKSQANQNHAVARTYVRKFDLVQHIKKKHSDCDPSVEADSWRQTNKKKFYSCGFCMCLCETFSHYLNHIDHVHFRIFKTLKDWDENKVILGLLQQPGVQAVWRRILASHSISSRMEISISWKFPVIGDLRRRLELSEETPESLAMSAWKMMTHDMGQDVEIEQDFSPLQLKYCPKAFDDGVWFPSQDKMSHDLVEVGAGVSSFRPGLRRAQDDSDPWDQLQIHEGEILPIMNLDPLNAIFSEKQKYNSDYCSTEANDDGNFADAQESGLRFGHALVRGSAHRSFTSQPNFYFSNVSTTLESPLCHTSGQSDNDVIELAQHRPPSRRSSVSFDGQNEKVSTEEETESIMLVRGMEKCTICQESDLCVSLHTKR